MDPAFSAASVYLVVLALIKYTILDGLTSDSLLILQINAHINTFRKRFPMLDAPKNRHQTLKLSPQEQLDVAFGLLNLKPPEIKASE